jgi:hypothetical protein
MTRSGPDDASWCVFFYIHYLLSLTKCFITVFNCNDDDIQQKQQRTPITNSTTMPIINRDGDVLPHVTTSPHHGTPITNSTTTPIPSCDSDRDSDGRRTTVLPCHQLGHGTPITNHDGDSDKGWMECHG